MPEPIVVALDPITAYVMFATELLKLVNVMISSQTADQQKIFWDRYLKDTEKIRKLFKIDD